MISVSEALNIILANRLQTPVIQAPLSKALNMRSATSVQAKLTQPPFDASAMDGYAVRLTDISSKGAKLAVIGEAPAGTPFTGTVGEGQAVRIFTGSPMPEGADTVIIQENVTRSDDTISVDVPGTVSRHIRRSGIDFKKGSALIEAGKVIGPADIALAAAGNHAKIAIYKRPKVAIIANGDELRPPGSEIGQGQIVSSNPAALSALIRHWGGEPMEMGVAADSLQSIAKLIKAAQDADIIVPVGGASVGDYDYMRQAFTDAGYTSLFEKIAVKPGKPTWFGTLGAQRVLGLPGNPASAIVCAHLFLKPLLGRVDALGLKTVELDSDLPANGSRETYLRGLIYASGNGTLLAKPFPRQDSSLMTPLAASNALIQLPPHAGPWAAGETIMALPLGMGPSIL